MGISLTAGVVNYEQYVMHEKMVKTIKSAEVQAKIEEAIKDIDPNALTKDGVIKSYEIDYAKIKRNPMGGIDGTIYVNHDKDMYLVFNLDKYGQASYDSQDVIRIYSHKMKEVLSQKGL